jgi:adenylate kinase
MLNIVRVTIEGLPGSGKSTVENAISAGTPKGYLVLNVENYKSESALIKSAEKCADIDTLVIVKTTTPKAN